MHLPVLFLAAADAAPAAPLPGTSLGQPSLVSMAFFFLFISITLGVTYWAARRTRSTADFYAAGGGITGAQNGFALAGDYMSAASFLGIAGIVALRGFDGLIYSTGFLVGWPLVLFLIAESLRAVGKYTFADVVSFRLRQRPTRIAAAVSTIAVVLAYLTAQMVGAGDLIHLLFGLDYWKAEIIVGTVMMVYVLFGGMLATTWVQIIKAVLLLGGALLLTVLVLARYHFNPAELFADAARQYGDKVLSPAEGPKATVPDAYNALSLGLSLMIGTAGLPHILMRFYTVPDARAARQSAFYATGLIAFFYLLTFILGFGAMAIVGQAKIAAVAKSGNMAAPLLAEALGGARFGPSLLGFISAVAFATILAVVAGLTLSGASALSHDLWVNVVRRGSAPEAEQLRVARGAAAVFGVVAIVLGIVFQGQNAATMVGLAFAIAASANFPALFLSIFWRRFTTAGAVASMWTGTISALTLIFLSPVVWVDIYGHKEAIFPLKNPGLWTIPLSFAVAILVSFFTSEVGSEAKFAEVQARLQAAGAE